MKLPSLKIRFKPSSLIHPLLILIILLELYFAYTLFYKNLNPQPTEVVFNKIVKVDLSAFQEISALLQSRREFRPGPLIINNQNPFRYNR